MKPQSKRLFDAFSDLDDDLIENALSGTEKRVPSPLFKRISIALASAAVIALSVLAAVKWIPKNNVQIQDPPLSPAETHAVIPSDEKEETGSYLTFDVNPSMQFQVEEGKVLSCTAFNEEGEAIFAGLDLNGKDLKEALTEVIGALVKEGYLKPTMANVSVLLLSARGENEKELLQNAVEYSAVAMTNFEIPAYIITQQVANDEVVKMAKEYGISVGKMQYILNLQKDRGDEFLKEAAGKSVVDLYAMDPKENVVRGPYKVGDTDEYGELILWVPEYEDMSGWRPWEALSEEYQKRMESIYSPEDLEILKMPRVYSTIPSVIGLEQTEARKLMNSRNIAICIVYYDDAQARADGFSDGQVYEQNIPAGMRWNSDAAIGLKVLMTGAYDPWDETMEYHYVKYWEPLPEGLNRGPESNEN